MMSDWAEKLGMVSGIVLPLFNIPLVLRIIKRRSSQDLSLTWAIGVWGCIVLMTPQVLRTEDMTFKVFGIMNIVCFTAVLFCIFKFRSKS